jgi:hypothetical protein
MTKADFYIDKKWIGSIFNDGYPKGILLEVLIQINETMFEELAIEFIQKRNGVVASDGGLWPHLWSDSRLTDYSYIFVTELGKVMASSFGKELFDPVKFLQGCDVKEVYPGVGVPNFPIMDVEKFDRTNQVLEGVKRGYTVTKIV